MQHRTQKSHPAATRQRQAKSDLRASEHRLRMMFEGAATGITVTALDGRFVYANPAYCATMGFTTKGPGEGTGLGLATVYGIVKQMGGYIWVYSEVGRGTSFKIYLPRMEEAIVAEAASTAPEPTPRGHETVLVVEDSESLRDLIQESLIELGYEVLAVTGSEEALALIQQGRHSVDLVLTDVVIPKLGVGELVKRLRASHPQLRVVYMSGYTYGAISRRGVLEEGAILLEKPFTAQNLGRTIRTALDNRP